MAEGWLRFFGDDKIEVHSAGVEAHGLNSRAVAVMKEVGIDISSHTCKTVDALKGIEFDIVITVCDNARERCPYFPAQSMKLHHDFPDPARATGSEEEIMETFRSVRDQIKHYCQAFAIQHLK
jgi:arsenate reductase